MCVCTSWQNKVGQAWCVCVWRGKFSVTIDVETAGLDELQLLGGVAGDVLLGWRWIEEEVVMVFRRDFSTFEGGQPPSTSGQPAQVGLAWAFVRDSRLALIRLWPRLSLNRNGLLCFRFDRRARPAIPNEILETLRPRPYLRGQSGIPGEMLCADGRLLGTSSSFWSSSEILKGERASKLTGTRIVYNSGSFAISRRTDLDNLAEFSGDSVFQQWSRGDIDN